MAAEGVVGGKPEHRRVRSEPFDFDEPNQDDILAGLCDAGNWGKVQDTFHELIQPEHDAELEQLQAYAKPSRGDLPPTAPAIRTTSWNSPPVDRADGATGAGSPDLSGQLNSVSLDEFPSASPRSVEAVWGELDQWMVGAPGEVSPTEMADVNCASMSEPTPEPAPATLHIRWNDQGRTGAGWSGYGSARGEGSPADDNTSDHSDDSAEQAATPPGQKRMRIPGGTPRKAKRSGKCQQASSAPLAEASASSTAPSAAIAASTPPGAATTRPTTPPELAEPPALMEKPLPSEIAYRMLTDDGYQPGARPLSFDGLDGRWVFKEDVCNRLSSGRSRVDKKADRWHNSGGVRGARDMPTEKPLVRRRYGSVSRAGTILWRFHEYSLVERVDDDAEEDGYRMVEDRSTVVFHVMPKRAGRGRPSKAEADLPAQLWKQFGFAN